jgi:hypothetical protein
MMVLRPCPEGPCPALEWQYEGRSDAPHCISACGLVTRPTQYFPVASLLHGAKAVRGAVLTVISGGSFCDAPDTPGDLAAKKEFWSFYAGRQEAAKEALKVLGPR